MTSSFSNLVGTERDEIPKLPVSNYASTEANMEEAVNKQIDENIKDQERFFKELGDIEELKSKNFYDNLSGLSTFVKGVAEFAEARERNREARESLKFVKELYKEKKNEILEFNEKKLDMNEAEQDAALREIAGENEEIYDFLKLKFAPNAETLEGAEFMRKYDDFSISGLNNIVKSKNIYNLPTRQDVVAAIDDSIENIVTKYLIDIDAKGLNPNSRQLRRHFIKRLFPALEKEKEKILGKWERISDQKYLNNIDRKVDQAIIETVNSKNADGDYDGIYDNVDVGLIQFVAVSKGIDEKQALDHIIRRMGSNDLRYFIEGGGLSHFMNEAEFTHRGTKKISKGYLNAGIGTQGEIDGNMGYLTRIQGEIAQSDSKLYKTLTLNSNERVRKLRQKGLSDEEFTMALAEEEVKFRKELERNGLDTSLPLPTHFLKDETSGVGDEYYSDQIGKKNEILGIVNINTDYRDYLRSDLKDPFKELTSLQKNIEVKAAEFELIQRVKERMKGDPSMSLEDAVFIEYQGRNETESKNSVLQKLKNGGYKPTIDTTRPTLAIDILNDQNYIKAKGVQAVMNQKGFISLDHKRALDGLYDYYESGFKKPFPEYFKAVTHGTNVMPHEFALATFKANFPGDASKMKNPETFFDLTEEESRWLYLRKNQTKNLQLLNNDENTEIEQKMLKSFEVNKSPGAISFPSDVPVLERIKNKINLEDISIGEAYELAKKGYSNFGLYGFSAEELIEVVDAGGIDIRDRMDLQSQQAMVFGLMRIQANKSNSIKGALVGADKDWGRLINLSDPQKTEVLKFFPNLRGMPNNQFQNLQGDITEIVIETIKTSRGDRNKRMEKIIEEYVENDGGIRIR